MDDSFNPYREWLGIGPTNGRPDHYALLGVSAFEADSATICAAAEQRIAAVFKIQAAQHLSLWQRTLAELSEAKNTLCDPVEKDRYDALLRSERAAQHAVASDQSVAPAHSGRNPMPPMAASSNPLPPVATGSLRPPAATPGSAAIDPMAPLTLPPISDVDPMAPVVLAPPDPLSTAAQTAPTVSDHAPPATQELAAGLTAGHAASSPVHLPHEMLAPTMPPRAAIALAARRRQKNQSILGGLCLLLLGAGAAAGVGYATGVLRLDRGRELSQSMHDDDGNALATKAEDKGQSSIPPTENGTATNEKRLSAPFEGRRSKTTLLPASNGNDAAEMTRIPESPATESGPVASPNSDPATDAAPADPATARRLKLELANTRLALGRRDWDAARKHLDQARPLATTADDQARVDAMARVEQQVAGFWQAVAEGIKAVDQTGELQVGSTFVAIVETGADHILIRAAGENRRYDMKQLPSGLAMALANRWFDTKPDNDVVRGAFMFVDPKGGADEARRLWQQAGQQDASLGTDALLKLLPLTEVESFGGIAVAKGPAPDSEDVAEAQRRIRDARAEEIAAATTAFKKLELAKAMLQSANDTDIVPESRYALLSLARDFAIEANQPSVAMEASELLTKWFEVDAIATKLQTLERLKPANAATAKAIAQAALTLFDEATRAHQVEAAKRIGQLSLAAAQKSQSADLVKQARERVAKAGAKK